MSQDSFEIAKVEQELDAHREPIASEEARFESREKGAAEGANPNVSADQSRGLGMRIIPLAENPVQEIAEEAQLDRPASSGRPVTRPGNQQDGRSSDRDQHVESPVSGLKSARQFLEDDDREKDQPTTAAKKASKDNSNEANSNEIEKVKNLEQQATKKLDYTPFDAVAFSRRFNGVFEFASREGETIEFSKMSLFCLSDKNSCRRGFVFLATWKWFDLFITIAIILNSFMLASTDYGERLDVNYVSDWEPTQEKIDLVFSIIFIIEAVVKIIAMGFIFHKKSYLREPWNCLDFFIVMISIVGMLPFSGENDSLKALRTFRILRPLRSINKMPTMRLQIQSLLASIPGLMRVFFFIIFIFCIFAIFGTNQFLGQQYQFCRATEEAEFIDGVFDIWPKLGDEEGGDGPVLCAEDVDCAKAFPDAVTAICGTVYEKYGLDPVDYDGVRDIELIMFGIPGFDNVAQAFLTVFQILTLESWVYLMYNYSDTGSGAISVIFFVLVVLLGAFFTMNLVLAIIVDSFDQADNDEEEEINATERSKLESSVSISKKEMSKSEEKKAEDVGEAIKIQEQNIDVQPQLSSTRNIGRGESGSILPELSKNNTNELAAKKIKEDEDRQEKGEHVLSEDAESNRRNLQPSPIEQEFGNISNIEKAGESPDPLQKKKAVEMQEFSIKDQPKKTITIEQMDSSRTPAHEFDVFDDGMSDLDEDEYEKSARQRSHQNGLYRCMYLFVTSVSFNFFIFLLIIGNTVTLAAYTFDQSELQENVLEIFNEFFTWIFFIEMVLKIIGLGFHNYRQDKYNVFDAVIVIISLVDWTLSRIPDLEIGSVLNAFRALRLLRMLKLSKSWKALSEILRKTAQSMKDISNFSLLLILFMYIFALLGMELFANVALIDGDDNLIVGQEAIEELYLSGDYYTFPRDNFNNIGYALTTIFIVIIGEDWNWSMYQWVRAYGYGSAVSYNIAIFFFLLVMIFGNIVLFSLFTAILLRNFEGGDEEEEEAEDEDDEADPSKSVTKKIFSKEGWEKIKDTFKEAFGKKKRVPRILTADGEVKPEPQKLGVKEEDREDKEGSKLFDSEQSDQEHADSKGIDEAPSSKKPRNNKKFRRLTSLLHYDPVQSNFERVSTIKTAKQVQLPKLYQKSLFCLGPTNPLRVMCHKLAENKWFQNIILLLIVISTITLALETPLDDPKGNKITILGYIDLFMTIAFTLEAVIKIIAVGFLFAGKNSYLREGGNVLDFVIVVSALLGVIAGDAIEISFIKALRILKILRPLRIIAREPKLRVAIVSLGRSIPNIVRLQAIVLFFVFLFAILQTTILSGQFYSCNTDHLGLSMKQQDKFIITMWDCINYGGEWTQPDLNFDTTFTSLMTLVTIQTTEGWIDVMWNSVDAVNPYYQPQENNNPVMILYTMILVICICMLFIELFVGVVIETFNNQKELLAGNSSLSRQQRSVIEVQMLALGVKSRKKLEADGKNYCRALMIRLTEHRNFDMFIMICIMANTFVLGFNWYMQPDSIKDVTLVLNYVFMVIFTVEAIVKIIAQKSLYFTDSWNLFDFTVVVLTIIILGIGWAGFGENLEILGTILRTLRIGRVFRLIKKQQKLQEIFKTLLSAAPSMASLGLLLMLLIFMFSIIGMSQFALVDLDGAAEMNQHVNFQSFGAAFLTLVRCSTGEAWNSIMFDSSQPRSILYQCNEDEDYYSIVDNGRDPTDTYGPRGCGNGFAVAFHLLFQVVVSQVFLNLFIAIIIDAFFGQTDLANMPVKEKTVEDFQRIWANFDKEASGFITLAQLEDLLIDLADAHQDEGGSLIPFKKRIKNDKKFRTRQIIALEIPTYEKMKKVMFHDVLMKLCFQGVKIYFQKDNIKELRSKLSAVNKIWGKAAINDDTLEAIHSKNVKPNSFDKEYNKLCELLKEEEPRADLVKQLKEKNKELMKKYNHLVDTNVKIMSDQQDEKPNFGENKNSSEQIELFTTRHLGSAVIIHDFIAEYLSRRARRIDLADSREAPSRISAQRAPLNPIAEVSSHQENTKDVGSTRKLEQNAEPSPAALVGLVGLPSSSGQPMSGSVEAEPEGDQEDSSVVPDQDWRNLR